jgi:hypothetical protein
VVWVGDARCALITTAPPPRGQLAIVKHPPGNTCSEGEPLHTCTALVARHLCRPALAHTTLDEEEDGHQPRTQHIEAATDQSCSLPQMHWYCCCCYWVHGRHPTVTKVLVCEQLQSCCLSLLHGDVRPRVLCCYCGSECAVSGCREAGSGRWLQSMHCSSAAPFCTWSTCHVLLARVPNDSCCGRPAAQQHMPCVAAPSYIMTRLQSKAC